MTAHPLLTTPGLPAAPALAGKTILLVEDEGFIAEMLTKWLRQIGVQALWANSGQEGVRLLAENREQICLVIADYRLPDMDGEQMCMQLRAIRPRLPVLLSSGRYHRSAEEALARSGPTCFIQKPYPLEDAFAKLQQLLAAAG